MFQREKIQIDKCFNATLELFEAPQSSSPDFEFWRARFELKRAIRPRDAIDIDIDPAAEQSSSRRRSLQNL